MMLQRLHRTSRNRTIGIVVALAAAVVVVATVAVSGGVLSARQQDRPASSPSQSVESPCDNPAVTCLGAGRYRFDDLPVPVTVALPSTFQGGFRHPSGSSIEDYRNDADNTGVTLMEDAFAVTDDASWRRDPAAGATAHAMAVWLSSRPFLTHPTLVATTVGGRPAWRVTAQLRSGASLPAPHGTGHVAPTFSDGGARAGVSRSLVGDYTLVDVPGAGVTVIWSWSFGQGRGVLAGNQPYVDGLSFG